MKFIADVINEAFCGISSLLTDTAIIYGSVVSSLVAKLPIDKLGDLDIALGTNDYNTVFKSIVSSGKWLPEPKIHPRYQMAAYEKLDRLNKDFTINTATFIGLEKEKLNLIYPRLKNSVQMQRLINSNHMSILAISIVRQSDLRCCTVGINKYGSIIETITGGIKDCKDKIITINNYRSSNFTNTKERIQKYISRGWTFPLPVSNIDALLIDIERERSRETREFIQVLFQTEDKQYWLPSTLTQPTVSHIQITFPRKLIGNNLKTALPRIEDYISQKIELIGTRKILCNYNYKHGLFNMSLLHTRRLTSACIKIIEKTMIKALSSIVKFSPGIKINIVIE